MKLRSASLSLVLMLLLLAAGPAAAQDRPTSSFIESIEVTDEAVLFHPAQRFIGYQMSVSGPMEFFFDRHFDGKERIVLPIKTEKGRLVDGIYTVELSARPQVSDEARKRMMKARDEGDRMMLQKLKQEYGLDDEASRRYMTSVGVVEGRFVDPDEEEPKEGSDNGIPGQSGAMNDASGVAPLLGQMRLTGRRWQPSYTPVGAGPQPIDLGEADAPPFAETWYEVTFEPAEGTSPALLQGFVRPLQSEGPAKLFQAYIRTAPDAAWEQATFRASGEGFEMMGPSAPLFDFVAQDDTHAPGMPFFHIGSGSIDGSLCVGLDCISSETFEFDTIRLKENNLRIKFMDTSSTGSFPPNDWQLRANSSANGGLNAFFIDDMGTANTTGQSPESTPFTIEANAATNAFYLDDGERLGLSTGTPVVELHIRDGDTPTVRLEQDNSSGFDPQTWDVAGNETNFFVRDVTGGSQLSFRIRPGAPSNSLFVNTNGDIGLNTSSPTGELHIRQTGAGNHTDLIFEANTTSWRIQNNANTGRFVWRNLTTNNDILLLDNDAITNLFSVGINTAGADDDNTVSIGRDGTDATLDVQGEVIVDGAVEHADYVFEDDFELESIEEHAAFMWQNKHLPALPKAPEGLRGPVNLVEHQMGTLEELEKAHIYIEQLNTTVKTLSRTVELLEARLAELEAKQQK